MYLLCFSGTLIVSPTVHLAFDETYYLERACTNIMLTLNSVGGQESKLKKIPENMLDRLSQYYNTKQLDLYAKRHFYSYWNLYAKIHPEVFAWVIFVFLTWTNNQFRNYQSWILTNYFTQLDCFWLTIGNTDEACKTYFQKITENSVEARFLPKMMVYSSIRSFK